MINFPLGLTLVSAHVAWLFGSAFCGYLNDHVDNLKDIPIQGFNYALKEQHPENVGVHFFLHDYQFERVWNYPDRYTEILSKFAFVLSPDFSPYSDSPKAIQIYNVYRNRWCARYWQEYGIKVIPTITWANDDSLSYLSLSI